MEPQQKIRGVSLTQFILRRVWVIIPPVNDALPGDQFGIGCLHADQLNLGWLQPRANEEP